MSNANTENLEKRKLDKAVNEFSHEKKMRLFQKVDEGYKGWDDKKFRDLILKDLIKDIHDIELMESNGQKCSKIRYIDISNRAMMLARFCD